MNQFINQTQQKEEKTRKSPTMGNKQDKPDFKQLSKETKFSTKELNEWFKNFKCNFPDGKIGKAQFTALYRKMWDSEGDASDFCDHVFRHYDRDGNGVIDFREFVTTLSVASKGSVTEKLQWAFKLYDIDGNGYLSEQEIHSVLTAIYKSRNQPDPAGKAKETMKKVFAKADDNKDGRISEEEFVKHAVGADSTMEELMQGF